MDNVQTNASWGLRFTHIHTTLDLVRQFYPPIIIVGCISIFRVCDGRILISHIQIHSFPNPTL